MKQHIRIPSSIQKYNFNDSNTSQLQTESVDSELLTLSDTRIEEDVKCIKTLLESSAKQLEQFQLQMQASPQPSRVDSVLSSKYQIEKKLNDELIVKSRFQQNLINQMQTQQLETMKLRFTFENELNLIGDKLLLDNLSRQCFMFHRYHRSAEAMKQCQINMAKQSALQINIIGYFEFQDELIEVFELVQGTFEQNLSKIRQAPLRYLSQCLQVLLLLKCNELTFDPTQVYFKNDSLLFNNFKPGNVVGDIGKLFLTILSNKNMFFLTQIDCEMQNKNMVIQIVNEMLSDDEAMQPNMVDIMENLGFLLQFK